MNATTHTTDKNVPADTQGKFFKGVVVKTAMKDTVTVSVERYVKHPKYKKFQRISKKFLVHNPGNTVAVGDTVEIRETRPISKRKRFVIVKTLASVISTE